MTYDQGYDDFWNHFEPQDDSSEYMIGWQDAQREDEWGEEDEDDEYWEEVITE